MRDFSSTTVLVFGAEALFSNTVFNCTEPTPSRFPWVVKNAGVQAKLHYKANVCHPYVRQDDFLRIENERGQSSKSPKYLNRQRITALYFIFGQEFTHYRVPTAQGILDAIKILPSWLNFTDILILVSFPNIWFKCWYCSWDVANIAAPLFLQDPHFNLYIPKLPHT